MPLPKHYGTIMSGALNAADQIHVAACRLDSSVPDHAAQAILCDAMHSALIVAEEARQAWKESLK